MEKENSLTLRSDIDSMIFHLKYPPEQGQVDKEEVLDILERVSKYFEKEPALDDDDKLDIESELDSIESCLSTIELEASEVEVDEDRIDSEIWDINMSISEIKNILMR